MEWINNHFTTAEGEYEFVLPDQLMGSYQEGARFFIK